MFRTERWHLTIFVFEQKMIFDLKQPTTTSSSGLLPSLRRAKPRPVNTRKQLVRIVPCMSNVTDLIYFYIISLPNSFAVHYWWWKETCRNMFSVKTVIIFLRFVVSLVLSWPFEIWFSDRWNKDCKIWVWQWNVKDELKQHDTSMGQRKNLSPR